MDLLTAHYQIVNLGIPIVGISGDGRIDFAPEATTQQKQQAEQLFRELLSAAPTERKTATEVSVEIAALTEEQRNTLINLMLAQFLVDAPHLAEKLKLPVTFAKVAATVEVKK